MSSDGRVLLIGEGLAGLKRRLAARGVTMDTTSINDLAAASAGRLPDALIVGEKADVTVPLIRALKHLRDVPIVIDGRRGRTRVRADGIGHTLDELESLVISNIAARHALARESLQRARLELALSATRIAATGVGVQALLGQVKPQLKPLLGASDVRVLIVNAAGTHSVLDGSQEIPIQLAVAPGFMAAMELQSARRHENTDYLPTTDTAVLCLAVTREAPLTADDTALCQDIALALVMAAQQHRLRSAASQQSLESAYVDRFRELNEANARLKALDRKKNDIVAMLSHDLRAPLNVLTGHAYLMETDPEFPKSLMGSLSAMKRTTHNILEMVESLLDANRGDGEKMLLFSRTMDVSETVIAVVRDLQVLAGQKGLVLKAEAPMSLEVHGDELKIRQALQNLITNSMQHARKATQILVRVRLKPRPDGDVALIEVSDDGQLANPDDILLAFERSRGLGLGIARDLVERHGGEIWAEAPRFGGAQFSFTLPMRSQPRMLAKTPGTTLPLILVADRDPVIARAIQLGLTGQYRVAVVRDGLEVVARAEAENAALVLMDLFMANRDGLQLIRDVKASPKLHSVPVMLMTSNLDVATSINAAEIGAAAVMLKPFQVSKLLQKIDLALKKSTGRDAETGLHDQIGFVRQLTDEAERGAPTGRALAMGVLRPVREISDVKAAARELRSRFRQHDVVGHMGKGVFVVLLPETSMAQAQVQVDRAVRQLADTGIQFEARIESVSEESEAAVARFEQLLLGSGSS